MRSIGFVLLLLLTVTALAEPVAPSDISVIDGDTIELKGMSISLVGFEAPELGSHAHCGLERMLAARATSRLRQIIRNGSNIDVRFVACSCLPGTEGTMACNQGRQCANLAVDGRDVADILMDENLAHPYVCGRYTCPPRQSWCPFVPAEPN